MNFPVVLFSLSLIGCALANAQNTTNPIKQSFEILHSGKFKNGISYFLHSQPKVARSFKIAFIVKAGTNMEKPYQYGAAHVLEHMSVRPTKNFPDVTLFLGKNSMVPGKGLIATTGAHYTRYIFDAPIRDSLIIDSLLLLFTDWIKGYQVNEFSVGKERNVVLNEIGLPNNDTISDITDAHIIFDIDNYLPSTNTIRRNTEVLDFKAVKDFQTTWYRPNLCAVFIESSFDDQYLINKIHRYFDGLENKSEETLPKPKPLLPGKGGKIFINLANNQRQFEITSFHQLKNGPEAPTAGSERRIIGQLFNRIMENREKQMSKPCCNFRYDASIEPTNQISKAGAFVILTRKYNKDSIMNHVKKLMLEERKLIYYGVSREELQDARQQLNKSSGLTFSQLENLIISLPEVFNLEKKNKVEKNILNKLTAEDVNEAMRKWMFTKEPDFYFIVHPLDSSLVPSLKDLAKWKQEVLKMPLEPNFANPHSVLSIINTEEKDSLQVKSPTYTRHFDSLTNLTTLKLANGITVMLKPIADPFGSDEIQVKGFKPVNTNAALNFQDSILNQLPAYILKNGLGLLNSDQLNQLMQETKTEMYTSYWKNGFQFNGATPDETRLDILFQYLYKYILTTQSLASDKTALKAFNDLTDFKLAIAGRFNIETVTKLANKYFGNLPSKVLPSSFAYSIQQTKKGLDFTFKFTNPLESDLKNRLSMDVLTAILKYKLYLTIRVELAGTYFVNVSTHHDNQKNTSNTTINFSSNNLDSSTLLPSFKNVIEYLKSDGPTADELQLGIRECVRNFDNEKLNGSSYWAEMLLYTFTKTIPFSEIKTVLNQPKIYESITADDIQTSARRNLYMPEL